MNAGAKSLLSVIVPVYNERATVVSVIERLATLDCTGEIIAVDDGSTDGTSALLRSLDQQLLRVHCLPQNRGKGAAVRVGLELARGDVLVIQDADLELDPGDLERLYAELTAGDLAVVYGSRFLRPVQGMGLSNRLANYALSLLTSLLFGQRLTDMETCYKMFTRQVYQRLRLGAEGFEIEPEITAQILKAGFPIHEVPIAYEPRNPTRGKKISWWDGVRALRELLRQRLRRR
jgi:glycosyltransferase involved in cell wall biosynthesis